MGRVSTIGKLVHMIGEDEDHSGDEEVDGFGNGQGEGCPNKSKAVLRLSKRSSFLHHPRGDFNANRRSSVGSASAESAASSSSSSVVDSAVSSPALSPPTSTVKSKPRTRKKVVPYVP